jgi:excinuclease ABC subunit A
VIKTAGRIIDLGPEGGEQGGDVVAQGTPEQVAAKADKSYTGRFVASIVKPAARRKRAARCQEVPAAA